MQLSENQKLEIADHYWLQIREMFIAETRAAKMTLQELPEPNSREPFTSYVILARLFEDCAKQLHKQADISVGITT